jgi:hypothetical protein
MHSNKSSVLMQSLLLVWCFILMLRELTVFSTWGVRPFAVGTFLVTATIGTVCYVIYTAYAEMDWRVVSQIKKKDGSARGLAAGKTFKLGDFIPRMASGKLKVLQPEEFEEQFEADPGASHLPTASRRIVLLANCGPTNSRRKKPLRASLRANSSVRGRWFR